jgi:hypothetical protein
MLVLHGTEDEQAPVAGMRQMEARMRALGKVCAFTFYEGARHGFAVRTHPRLRRARRDAELRRGEALSGDAPRFRRADDAMTAPPRGLRIRRLVVAAVALLGLGACRRGRVGQGVPDHDTRPRPLTNLAFGTFVRHYARHTVSIGREDMATHSKTHRAVRRKRRLARRRREAELKKARQTPRQV